MNPDKGNAGAGADGKPSAGAGGKTGAGADGKPDAGAGGKPSAGAGGKAGAGADGKPGAGAGGKPGAAAGGKPGEGAGGKPGEGAGGKPGEGAGGKPDAGADGKPGAGADGKPGGGAGAPGAGGKEESAGKKEGDEPKGLQKIFDLYSKSGGLGGGGSGLNKDNGKKWLKAGGLLDEKTGCSEKDFDSAFDKASKGEKSLDFNGFKQLIETISKEKKKEPKELFDKLIQAGPPKDDK